MVLESVRLVVRLVVRFVVHSAFHSTLESKLPFVRKAEKISPFLRLLLILSAPARQCASSDENNDSEKQGSETVQSVNPYYA